MALNRGGKAGKEESDKGFGGRLDYLKLEDGESIVLRFLDDHDAWPYVKQHSFVPTKGAPSDLEGDAAKRWPKTMGSVCRRDKLFRSPDSAVKHDDCFICDSPTMVKSDGKRYFPQVRFWARAVVREPVYVTDEMVAREEAEESDLGVLLGYRDAEMDATTKDEKGNDTTKRVKKIVWVNMAWKNFFGPLQGYADVYKTVLDRDYHVTRVGEKTDTDYNIVPLEKISDFDLYRDKEMKARYEAFAAEAGASEDHLEKKIYEQASDEFYARYFDTTKPFPASKKSDKGKSGKAADDAEEPTAPAAQQAKPEQAPVNQDRLAALKARVMEEGNKPKAAAAPKNVS